jgi:glycosyltransferase-like protein LARGE
VGYFGTVYFSDVMILPLPETGKWGTSPSDIVAHCATLAADSPIYLPQPKYSLERMDMGPPGVKSKRSITLVTQVSMDRLTILEKSLLTWPGPVSLAVYIPVKDMKEGLAEWQRLYVEKKIRTLNLTTESHVTLVTGSDEEADYPINVLRNVAIKSSQTKYLLLIDADFQPCPDLEQTFLSTANKFDNTSGMAFVVPAFEYLETPKKGDGIPKTKEEFLQLLFRAEPMVQPFRVFESADAHRLTDYWKWFNANAPYSVQGFSDKYEPYLIVEKSGLPLFDEHFSGYGMNKVSHATELYAVNYQFKVLHNLWMTHLPHKTSTFSQDFLQNSHSRLKNRARRFQFVLQLIQKYTLPQSECTKYSK